MSHSRRSILWAASAVLVIVAASLALAPYFWTGASDRQFAVRLPWAAVSATVTPTVEPTETLAPTQTLTASPTATPTVTATPSPVPPTATASPSPTITLTPLPTPTSTPESVSYTVIISDVYARREPAVKSPTFRLAPRGRTYLVQGRSVDGIWLQIDMPEAKKTAWVPAAFGLLQGPLSIVPLAGPTLTPKARTAVPPTPDTRAAPSYAYLSGIGPHARDIYKYGLLLGNNPHAFIKIGDCQAITPYFLAAFDYPQSYRLGPDYAYLQAAIDQFKGSFSRQSVAANTGFGAATVLDPQWADPAQCRAGESPLICEYRTMRPSLALISLGTNDSWQTDDSYEKDLRRIVEYLIRQGVLPVLSTKADNVEGDGRFNALVVRLTAEYQLPLWDFWQVTRALPSYGLKDSYHLSWGPAVFDDPKSFQLGWPWRNLTALQTLDAIWRAVR